jgi:hypothetical protein
LDIRAAVTHSQPSKNFTGLYANWKPQDSFIVSADFYKANCRKRLPKFYQDIDCGTRAAKTLDHCYSNFWDAYKALPHTPFGKSDRDSILLLASYRQKLTGNTCAKDYSMLI